MGMVLVLIGFPIGYIVAVIVIVRLLAWWKSSRHERRGFEVIRNNPHDKKEEEAK